jgi:hypothetical protein
MVLHRPPPAMWLAAVAFLTWFAVTGALSKSLFEPLIFIVQIAFCLLIGYAVISLCRRKFGALEIVLAVLLGLEICTSVYAVTRAAGFSELHLSVFLVGAVLGVYRLSRLVRIPARCQQSAGDETLEWYAMIAGIVVMLTVGSAFFFSGRDYGDGLTFFGPMGRDHIFHLALIGRLAYVVPPDNFIAAGHQAPSYHFFSDLSQYLLAKDMGANHDIMDVYYRLYPGLIFFLIGFLSFWVSARLFASRTAGVIGLALLVFGADLSWVLGLLQTIRALPDLSLVQDKFFGPWFSWSAFGTIYPLVHRPAYYHGLALTLAGLAVLAGRGGKTNQAWMVAGLCWGLMAGFNYTLAVTIGLAVVCSCGFFLFNGNRDNLQHLSMCAVVMVFGSLVANFFVLSQGSLLNQQGTSLFLWAPGEFLQSRYGWMFGGEGGGVTLVASVIIFLVVSYGVRLFGFWPMFAGHGFRFRSNDAIAAIALVSVILSMALGLLFVNKDVIANNNIIYLQPTGWIMSLFATYPIVCWINQRKNVFRMTILAFFLLVGALQAIPTFNLSYKVVFEPQFVSALHRVGNEADGKDVIAYWPDSIMAKRVFGPAEDANNFYVSAFTGLRGYFSVKPYLQYFAGGQGGSEVYERRSRLIRRILEGDTDHRIFERLVNDDVRWVVLPKELKITKDGDVAKVWDSSEKFTILRVNRHSE